MMRILVDGIQIEVEAEPTTEGWRAWIMDVDEETGAKCVIALAEGDSRRAAMNWALANYFASLNT